MKIPSSILKSVDRNDDDSTLQESVFDSARIQSTVEKQKKVEFAESVYDS